MLVLGTSVASAPTQSGSSTCLVMSNFANAQYTVNMNLGSPGQTLKMIPDSGSSDLVVPSSQCKAADGCKGACPRTRIRSAHPLSPSQAMLPAGVHHSKFNPAQSSTFEGPLGKVDVTYGQGDTECLKIKDVVQMGHLKATAQDMLLITTNGLTGYAAAMYDGILGLGIEKLCRKNTPSILTNLPSVDRFTLCIGNRDQENGVLVVGDSMINALQWPEELHFHARPIYTGNIPFWGLYMSSLEILGEKLECEPNCAAIIDSGTSLMSLPSKMAWKVLDAIGVGFSADCSDVMGRLPDIVFTIEGTSFRMAPSDYMVVVDSDDLTEQGLIRSGSPTALSSTKHHVGPFGVKHLRPKHSAAASQCAPAFTELDESTNRGKMVILGMPFLRSYATSFDRGDGKPGSATIRFAKVDNQPGVCSTCESALMDRTELLSSSAFNTANKSSAVLPRVRMSAVRLPWWAPRLAARAEGRDAEPAPSQEERNRPAHVRWGNVLDARS